MMTTKRLLFAAVLCVSSFAAQAQENNVKLDIVSLLAISQFNLNYERMIDPRKSVNVQLGYGWGSDLTKTFQAQFDANSTAGTNSSNIKMNSGVYNGGFQIAPEFRFYMGDQEGPRGFYLAPQLNFSSYSMTFKGTHQYTTSSGATATANDKIDLGYTAIGGGLQLGAQWIIGDHVSIDWGFLGIGLLSGTVTGTGTSDDKGQLDKWATDTQSWTQNPANIGGYAKFLGFTSSADKISVSGSTLVPNFRSTLSVGYAF